MFFPIDFKRGADYYKDWPHLFQADNLWYDQPQMISLSLEPVFKSPIAGHYFFGYYDKSPLDASSTRLLAMRVSFIDRMPTCDDVAGIGYFDLNSGHFNEITTTNAFNWQQGSMLQWLGPTFDRQIVFNRRTESGFQAVIFDIESKQEKLIGKPIYVVSPLGEQALTIDFERHYWCRRGYSYDGVINPEKNLPVVPGDGIWSIDIRKNQSRQIISLEQLIAIAPIGSMRGATHYIEHLMYSSDGKSFAFYHRWRLEEGGIYTRMYVVQNSNEQPRLIHDTGRLNHYCWLDHENIFAGGGRTTTVNILRKYKTPTRVLLKPLMPLYRQLIKGNAIDGHSVISRMITGDCYFLVNIRNRKITPVFQKAIDRDGHPSAVPGKDGWVVTDTYPDPNGTVRLMLGNISTQQLFLLDELQSIPSYDNSPLRCDLHPKVSRDGRFVSIDTMNDGVRGIYLYKLPDET